MSPPAHDADGLRGPLLPSAFPRTWLLLEAAVLYLGVPLFLRASKAWIGPWIVLVIIASGLFCWSILRADPRFDRGQLFRLGPVRAELPRILRRFGIATALFTAGILLFRPEDLFAFPRQNPKLWALVMVGYPLASVFPQELIFRAFLGHRYRAFFGRRTTLLLANAVTFGIAHILFKNWFAPLVCTAGGWILADTWLRTKPRSLLAPCIEHALYGQMLFTVGYGRLLYAGAAV